MNGVPATRGELTAVRDAGADGLPSVSGGWRVRRISAGGVDWCVRERGRGPRCWMLHGTGSSGHSWDELGVLLSRNMSLMAPDLPGHGDSIAGNDSDRSMGGMARALAALAGALGDEPQWVIGHSAGAAVAARMALDGTIRPRGIIGINAALVPFGGAASPLFQPLARWVAGTRWLPGVIARHAGRPGTVERLIDSTGSRLAPRQRQAYRELLTRPAHVAATLSMMAGWDLDGLWRDLPGLRTPLWLIVGDDDRTVPPTQADRVAHHCAEARVVHLGSLGHLAHEEDPRAVADAIREKVLGEPAREDDDV